MRKVILFAVFFLILTGCRKNEAKETESVGNVAVEQNKGNQDAKVIVAESTESEFYAAAVSAQLFRRFNTDTIPDASLNRSPVEIVTRTETLIFKNINPAFDRGFYDESKTDYFNLGFSSVVNKHLLYAGYYEFEELILIDHSTTKRDTLIGLPHFSPNAQRIVAYNVDPYGEDIVGDIEVFAVNKTLSKLFKQSFNFIPVEVRWLANNDIVVKAISIKNYTGTNGSQGMVKDNFMYKKISFK
jgi:hypothetical protein